MKFRAKLYIISTVLIATACSHDDYPGKPTEPTRQSLTFGVSPTTVAFESEEQGRAGLTKEDIRGTVPHTIGVWAMIKGSPLPLLNNRTLYNFDTEGCPIEIWSYHNTYSPSDLADQTIEHPEVNTWPYRNPVSWTDDEQMYRFFAYSPYTTSDRIGVQNGNISYDEFNTILWKNIPRFTSEDYSISDRLVDYTSNPGNDVTQIFRMKHLQSRIRFCFKLGPKFSKLRAIYLRHIDIVDVKGITSSVTIIFNENPATPTDPTRWANFYWSDDPGTVTAATISLENDQVLVPGTTVYRSPEGIWLTTEEFTPLASVYVLGSEAIQQLNMVSTYDVYDLVDADGDGTPEHWQLLRKGDTTKNTINLGVGAGVLQPGCYFDVNLTIEPNFLYVLSDNDEDPLDDPNSGLDIHVD